MDLQRVFLFLIFAFSLMLVWDGWQRYQHPEPQIQQGATNNTELSKSLSTPTALGQTVVPAIETGVIAQQTNGKTIHIKTDILEAEINTIGGDISRLALIKHKDSLDKNKPLVLFNRGKETHNYSAQSGLIGAGLPNHNSLFFSEQDQYELSGNAEQVEIRLRAEGDSKLKVTKIITFHKGSYLIGIAYELENAGQQTATASSYFQLIRDSVAPEGSLRFLPTYTGAAVYTDKDKLKKVQFSDIDKGKTDYPKQSDNGWIGILQHYFVAAWLPEEKTNREFFTHKLDGGMYSVGMVLPSVAIDPGQKAHVGATLYAGPTEANLDKIAPGLGLTVDYGWLTIIAVPLFWVMSLLNDWTHNWGVAIILLTFLIKLLFFPLSAASYRSMAKMRMVAPKLEKIKQQYANDL